MSDVLTLYKYSGAGNDFVVLDGRGGGVGAFRAPAEIGRLCRAHHTDGLMILGPGEPGKTDFTMEFYNPDGSGGMMCGNGGRCIVAFADALGIRPGVAPDGTFVFRAPDGLHTAGVLGKDADGIWTIRLKMIDVHGVASLLDGNFLQTGTRHFVRFVPDVDAVDVEGEGRPLRWREEFAPEGTNVNFVSLHPDGLHVRTFEKGVEGETLACGTGITASALAAWHRGVPATRIAAGETLVHYDITARRGDRLAVEFTPHGAADFTEVFLIGPAEQVAVLA